MTEASNRLVQKLWSYCQVLRDDGLSYQDYLEQLTFLLFLKMADEREKLTGEKQAIPKGYRWADLACTQMEGSKLEQHYRETLRVLGLEGGMLRPIFRKAQNKIQDPAKLRQLIVELIGKEEWLSLTSEVKGDAYEGLLCRWRPYSLDEILARDKVSLDLFWLRDESLEDSANLPDPHILAEEIADDLRSALEQIESALGR